MAVRSDANTDRVTFTGPCPDPSAGFTLLGWIKLEVDQNTNSAIARSSAGGVTSFNFATALDGTTLSYFTGGGSVASPVQLVVGTWFCFAVQQTGGTATIKVGTDPGSLTSTSGAVAGAANPDHITFFGRAAGDGTEWFNGDGAYFREFSRLLSDPEIIAELGSPSAVSSTGLFADWWVPDPSDLTDHSGNGRHLVAGPTALTVAAGPPISNPVTSTLTTLASSITATIEVDGDVAAPLVLFSTAIGEVGGGAEVSSVLCSSWANVADVPTATREQLAVLTDLELGAFLLRASEILWALSGRRWYGQGCTETATLRSHPPQPGQGTWPYHRMWGACACWGSGMVLDGRLFPNFADYRGEHIASPMAVKLPRSRVNSIVSVTVDGDPFAAYRMLQSGWVERTDGQGWRMCDDSTVIVYTFGESPPAGGRDAAVDLGVELAKARIGDKSCRLPQRVTSVTRQGLSFSQIDPFTFLDKGRTGLLLVDMWLASVNPEARPQAAGVWSPDIPGTIRS